MKFKQDSLVTIEAKKAIFDSKREDIFQFDDIIGKFGSTKKLPTIMEDKGEEIAVRATSLSPIKGSQGVLKWTCPVRKRQTRKLVSILIGN
jgi:hypothetical protein